MNRERKAAAIAFAAIGLVAAIGWGIAYQFHVGIFEGHVEQRLNMIAPAIEGRVGGFGTLADVLSDDAQIAATLNQPDRAAVEELNARLDRIARGAGASQIFVLDTEGRAIASSTWVGREAFPDFQLGFRPYFQDAMANGTGGLHAFDVATGAPGSFLASRMDTPDGPLGVVVVRFVLLPGPPDLWGTNSAIAVADNSGIIILSSLESWRYRTLHPLSADNLGRITETHQYDGVDFGVQPPLFEIGAADETYTIDGEDYILRTRPVGQFGWTLIVAQPFSGAQAAANAIAMMLVLFGFVVSGLVLIFLQHRQLAHIRNEQSALLEQQVAERTRELADEVEIRRRTEKNLRDAESDLIQATKMAALGQMSAALAHEVSQPITALAAMLTAAERRLEAAETDNAQNLLERAQNLVQRIQHIIRHLRSFSKKESGESGRLTLVTSIKAALELAEPRAREIGVTIATVGLDQSAEVIGSPVRLEQVLINLFLNALDAVTDRDPREVGIVLEVGDEAATISVWDSGPGVPEGFAERLAEPFFTTKSDGDGVGLGLTISQSILADFGASLRFLPRPGGGTVCEVRLPLADAPETAEAAE